MLDIILNSGVTAKNSTDKVSALTVFLLLKDTDNRKVNKIIFGSDKNYKK